MSTTATLCPALRHDRSEERVICFREEWRIPQTAPGDLALALRPPDTLENRALLRRCASDIQKNRQNLHVKFAKFAWANGTDSPLARGFRGIHPMQMPHADFTCHPPGVGRR
jgi:hypothetical protein